MQKGTHTDFYDGSLAIYSLAWEKIARSICQLLGIPDKIAPDKNCKVYMMNTPFFDNLIEDGNYNIWCQHAYDYGKELKSNFITGMEQPVLTNHYTQLPFGDHYHYKMSPYQTLEGKCSTKNLCDSSFENRYNQTLLWYQYMDDDESSQKNIHKYFDFPKRQEMAGIFYPRWQLPGAAITNVEIGDQFAAAGHKGAAQLMYMHAVSLIPSLKTSMGYKASLGRVAFSQLSDLHHSMNMPNSKKFYALLAGCNQGFVKSEKARKHHLAFTEQETKMANQLAEIDKLIKDNKPSFLQSLAGIATGVAGSYLKSDYLTSFSARLMAGPTDKSLREMMSNNLDFDIGEDGEKEDVKGSNYIPAQYCFSFLNHVDSSPDFLNVLAGSDNPFPELKRLANEALKINFGAEGYVSSIAAISKQLVTIERAIQLYEGKHQPIPGNIKL